MRAFIVGVSLLVLSGCQTIPFDEVQTNKKPTYKHKQALIQAAKEVLFDPYSVRDAELSNQLEFGNKRVAYCGRLNSKNRLGGYVGLQYVLISFSGDKIVQYYSPNNWCYGNKEKLRWNRFVELEAL